MKVRSAVLVFALAQTVAAFGQETYVIDPNHTIPRFEIFHAGYSLQRGSFSNTTGRITLDRAAKKGTIDATIDVAMVNTNQAARDAELKSERFFNVALYPTMTFKSSNLRFDGDSLVGADGELTLLGVARPVTLAVANFKCGPHPLNKAVQMCGAEVTTSIKRSAWGMSSGIPSPADDVKIAIPIEAIRE